MAYRQTLKLGMDKLWQNAEAKGYVIISVDCLAWPQRATYAQFAPPAPSPPHFFFGLILPGLCDFSRTYYLCYLIVRRIQFLEKCQFLLIFLVFWGYVNWPPKFNFTFIFKFNFGYIPSKPKLKLFENSSTTAFLCLKTTSGENFSKIEAYLRN